MPRAPEFIADRPKSKLHAGGVAHEEDVLTGVLDALGVRGRVFCRSELRAPWGLVLPQGPGAHFHVVERGRCSLRLAGASRSLTLTSGDLVLVPHGRGHTLADPVDAAARPLATQTRPAAGCVGRMIRVGGGGAETRLLCGAFHFARAGARSLLQPLPDVIHVPAQAGHEPAWLASALHLLMAEAQASRPGAEAVVSRLTDVILVQALRAWIGSLPPGRGGWLGALRDPQVAGALTLMHRAPERRWTVATLAGQVGLSRSPFAARFTQLVGEPPLAYLTRWRLLRAARALGEEPVSLQDLAARVGYVSVAAFSRAFQRSFGVAPGAYRRQHAGRASAARELL
jgi:AraC-like DNA-binding protein